MNHMNRSFFLIVAFWLVVQNAVFGKEYDKTQIPETTVVEAIRKQFAEYYKSQKFFSVKEAGERYGKSAFNAESFRKGGWKRRSAMAADLVERKTLVGKTESQVYETLGRPDAFFWDEHIPAYIIEDGREPKHLEVMIVVFFETRNGEKRVERLLINWEDLKRK